MDELDLKAFRKKVKETREWEWIRDAIRLRDKSPEETLEMMFDLLNFAERMSKATR